MAERGCTATSRRSRLTTADARAYVAGGGIRCPSCNDANISGGPVEVEAGGAWQEVTCADRDAAWHDVYTLAGIDLLDERGRYLDTLDGTIPRSIAEVLDDVAMSGEPGGRGVQPGRTSQGPRPSELIGRPSQ